MRLLKKHRCGVDKLLPSANQCRVVLRDRGCIDAVQRRVSEHPYVEVSIAEPVDSFFDV